MQETGIKDKRESCLRKKQTGEKKQQDKKGKENSARARAHTHTERAVSRIHGACDPFSARVISFAAERASWPKRENETRFSRKRFEFFPSRTKTRSKLSSIKRDPSRSRSRTIRSSQFSPFSPLALSPREFSPLLALSLSLLVLRTIIHF